LMFWRRTMTSLQFIATTIDPAVSHADAPRTSHLVAHGATR
jgi:hypothetical protein